jgi:flagellar hook-basal body complex protein FliE
VNEWVQKLFKSFQVNILSGKPANEYLDNVCREFEARFRQDLTAAKDTISHHTQATSKLQKAFAKYQHEILNLAGYDSDYKKAQEFYNKMSRFVNDVNELLIQAMVDPDQLMEDFRSGKLAFQNV